MSDLDLRASLTRRLLRYARPQQLQLVVQLAELGSVQRAAPEVGLSQPAATQALARIEALLDATLFDRHARGMRPTPLGLALLPAIRRALAALEAVARDAVDLNSGARGVLRAAGTLAASRAILAPAIAGFHAAHPDIAFEYVELTDADIRRLSPQQDIDVFLCRESVALAPGYVFSPLCGDRHSVFAAPEHPLAHREALTLADCAAYAWLLPPWGLAPWQAFTAWCQAEQIEPRVVQCSARSIPVTVSLIAETQLLYVGPESHLGGLVRAGRLSRLALSVPAPLGDLGMWAVPHPAARGAVACFTHYLQRWASQAPLGARARHADAV